MAIFQSKYSLCLKNGLGGIEKRFGLSAEHFGENFLDGYTKNDVEQVTKKLLILY